jgi:2,3-dihydroxy-p-cumate/2,3-dihydroxybenzoate 3,4-dioxygenase
MKADPPFPFRYKKLAYAALNVTDLARSIPFYRDILGLDLVAHESDAAYFRCSREHQNIVLYQAPERGLRRVAFQLETTADLDVAFAHFQRVGLDPQPVPREQQALLHQGRSFRVREPSCGLQFELFATAAELESPFVPTVASILRVGHVVIGSTDFDGTRQNLTDKFGFRVSDFVEGRFAFLRAHPNPFHHSLAVGLSPENHLHHVNFMVTDIDDVGRAIHRLNKHGVKIVFGPGRHPPSGSVFLYFLDPDGMTVEYSFGMEEFPEVDARPPRMLEPVPSSLDTWGAIPDPLFAKSGPIQGAT